MSRSYFPAADLKNQKTKCLKGKWMRIPADLKVFLFQNADVEFYGDYAPACIVCSEVGRIFGEAECRCCAEVLERH